MKLKFKFQKGMKAVAQAYKTKQRTAIEKLLMERAGEHLTADEIMAALGQQGFAIGKATVYRCLERMMEQGTVKRYAFNEGKSASYEYQGQGAKARYHLKCCGCGEMTHLECELLDTLPQHIFEHHGFTLDAAQTVLMGRCEKCRQIKGE